MKKSKIACICAFIFSTFSCKKESSEPNIVYRSINQTVKASDLEPLYLDLDQNGTTDYVFFAVYNAFDSGVRLNIGTNPIGNNRAKMALPNDDNFLNMGPLASLFKGAIINERGSANQIWNNEFAYLTIRTEAQGKKTYIGDWRDGEPKIMALQLYLNGKSYFGWARLSFDRSTEVLTLIDCAWNTTENEEIKAGK